jgi:hypothetical protein
MEWVMRELNAGKTESPGNTEDRGRLSGSCREVP